MTLGLYILISAHNCLRYVCIYISTSKIIYKQHVNSTAAEIVDAYNRESLERHRKGRTFLVFPRESCTKVDHSSTRVTRHYGHHLSRSLHSQATNNETTLKRIIINIYKHPRNRLIHAKKLGHFP